MNGKVVQIYPGICRKKDFDNCITGTNFNIAYPANESDPFYTEWTKPSFNPVVNNTQRDPSTAWKTPYGEWRLTSFDTTSYASKDFINWYSIGKQPGFSAGECPSFFKLPRTVRVGDAKRQDSQILPTHVHKFSLQDGRRDWMQVGTWIEGTPGNPGKWTKIGDKSIIDSGNFYASKDFYDPVKNRRINFGWAVVSPGSTLSLGREVVYNVDLQQLEFAPLEEQKSLRSIQLANVSKTDVLEGWEFMSRGWGPGAGRQIEIVASFSLQSILKAPSMFGVVALTGQQKSNTNGVYFYLNITTETINCMRMIASGGEDGKSNTCNIFVGALKQGQRGPSNPLFSDTLRISPAEDSIELRVFVDQTFHEAYWQNGRVAMTVNNPQQATALQYDGVALRKDFGEVKLEFLNIFQVDSIWISKTELLDQMKK